jgi:hypothetical protein
MSLRSILILSTQLHLCLPSGLFLSGFPTNILNSIYNTQNLKFSFPDLCKYIRRIVVCLLWEWGKAYLILYISDKFFQSLHFRKLFFIVFYVIWKNLQARLTTGSHCFRPFQRRQSSQQRPESLYCPDRNNSGWDIHWVK